MSTNDPSFVDANGVRFAYLEEGSGPLVLLVHGFPDTAHTWDEIRPKIAAAGYRVVAPFTRGYYPTEIPADGKYDIVTLGTDLLALITALGERDAILVGHDWGGAAVHAAAQLDPTKVRLLVTVAIPHPLAVRPVPRVAWGARHFLAFQLPGAVERFSARGFEGVDTLVRRWSPTWKFTPNDTARIRTDFERPGRAEAALGYYRAFLPVLPRAMRRRIEVPSVAFAGLDDPILHVSDFVFSKRFYSHGLTLVTTPGGHFLHREDPDRFARELIPLLTHARD